MKVRLSGDARAYLQQEAAYLKARSRAAAENFLARMREARGNLAQFPEMGSEREGLPLPGMRRLVVGAYLLDYEITRSGVSIVSIRHSRQSPLPVDPHEDFEDKP